MRKAAVRHGDPTTTRGFVMAYSSTIHDDGKKVALSGDEATCGNCKGMYKIFGTGKGMSEKGRDVVVEGDLVLCPCQKNRVMVGSNPGVFLTITENSVPASNAASAAQSGAASGTSVATYDEQVRAAAPRVELDGYPYFIETADGRTHAGRIDASGYLPRMYTDSSDDYMVYWGDQALAIQNGL
ncbi:PAAR domain-containing protein [Paraburkholderia terrae]